MSNQSLTAGEESKVTDELQHKLNPVYTPGAPITEPALFAGRHQPLETVKQTRGIGMNYVIQGLPGLGKTSFARQRFSGTRAFWHTASEDTDFVSIFLAMLVAIDGAMTDAEKSRLVKAGVSGGSDAIFVKGEFGTELNVKQVQVAAQRLDLDLVLERVVRHQRKITCIVIDEFQRIKDPKIHTQVVQVIKGLADRGSHVTVALVGITAKGEELVKDPEYPRYLGRHITTIRLKPMTEPELLEIFQVRKAFFGVTFPPELQKKISWISCGYPYIVQKLGKQSCMNWAVRSAAQIISDFAVSWFKKHILRQKEVRTPDVRELSVSIDRDDVIKAVQGFVTEYEGNYLGAEERLQGLRQTEREQLLSGNVDEIEAGDQYFPCYGRAKEYLKASAVPT
jgi:hypothetical protein